MQRKVLCALAMLLLIASIAHAQPMPNVCRDSDIRQYWSARFGGTLYHWQDLCALGLMISFFIISLVYMFSQIFGKPDLAAWCKKEIFQVAVTGLLLAGIFGFVNFSCTYIKPSLFVSGVPEGQNELFPYSISYLEWLRNASYKLYIWVSIFNSLISGLSFTVIYQSPGAFGLNIKPLGGFSFVSSILSFSMNAISIGGIWTTIANLRMLRAIQIMMFNIILPIGLICRCFEPFRRFGGSMIAIAVGLFLFYPILLVLNAGIVHERILTELDLNRINSTDSTGVGQLFIPGPYSSETQLSIQTAYSRSTAFYDQTTPYYGETGQGYRDLQHFYNIYNELYSVMLKLLVASLFLPLFNFILVITFIRNLSRILGEEIDVTNITRLI